MTVEALLRFLREFRLTATFEPPGPIACRSVNEPDVPAVVAALGRLGVTFPEGRSVVFNNDHFGYISGWSEPAGRITVMVHEAVSGYRRELRF